MKTPQEVIKNQMIKEEFSQTLEAMGYLIPLEIPGRGVCAIMRQLFTVAIVYGIDEHGFEGRYCYPSMQQAIFAFSDWIYDWDGIGDPPGDWIKHKGRAGEWGNPNYQKSNLQ